MSRRSAFVDTNSRPPDGSAAARCFAGLALIVLLLSGMPVAFALGFTAIAFLLIQDGPDVGAFEVVAETLFASLDEFALLSIPMFLVMGSAIAASRAGSDLCEGARPLIVPRTGRPADSNIGACGVRGVISPDRHRRPVPQSADGHSGDAAAVTGQPRKRARSPPAALWAS